MPLFKGPVQLANEQWVLNLASGVSDLVATAPKLQQQDEYRKEMEIINMRGALATQATRQQAADFRAKYIDSQIAHNRQFNQPSAQILNQRKKPRLTIAEINRMTKPQLINALGVNKPTTMEDQRGGFMKFLDLVDLPRNSVFNVAFTDRGTAEDVIAGGGLMTGAGAVIGGIIGSIVPGPGTVAGALVGAKVGATAYGLTLGTSLAVGSLLDEEDKKQIRLNSIEHGDLAARGRPRVYFSEVLDRLGMEEGTKRSVLGFVGDVLLDPLSYATGGGQVVKWGAKGTSSALSRTGVRVVETRGIAYIKDFAKEALKQGKFVKDSKTGVTKLILPENSQYKSLENFYNNTLIIGDDALADIGMGMDRGKSLADAMKAIQAAQGKTLKRGIPLPFFKPGDVKKLQARVLEASRDELMFFQNFTKLKYADTDMMKLGELSREFFKRFQAKSAFQTHLPFADWIHPLYRRKVGYKNVFTNMPLYRFDRVGRAKKALGKTDEAFIAAETLKHGERVKEIAGELGKFKGVNLLRLTGGEKGAALSKTIRELKENMPASLRDKIHFTRSETKIDRTFLPESVTKKLKPLDTEAHGVRVEVTNLNASELDYLTKNGWKFEYDTLTTFDETALRTVLKDSDSIKQVQFAEDSIRLRDEFVMYGAQAKTQIQKLEAAQEEHKALSKMKDFGDEGEALKGIESQDEIDKINFALDKASDAKKELAELAEKQNLTTWQIQDLISKPTSAILDAANNVRGAEFHGKSIAMFEGPGFLGRLMGSYNAKTHNMQVKLSAVDREYNLIVKQIQKAKAQVIEGAEDIAFKERFAAQIRRVAELKNEKEVLLEGASISVDAGIAAKTFQAEGFLKTNEEVEAAASFMDAMFKNRKAEERAMSSGAWFKKYFGDVRKDGVPGENFDDVFFHTSPSQRDAIITLRNIKGSNKPHTKWTDASSSIKNFDETDTSQTWLDETGSSFASAKKGASLAHTKDGQVQGNVVVKLSTDMSNDELDYWASVHALDNDYAEASIFEVADNGPMSMFEFSTADQEGVAQALGKLLTDNNLEKNKGFTKGFTYHILDDGTVRVIAEPHVQRMFKGKAKTTLEDAIKKIAGDKYGKTKKGNWRKVGEGAEEISEQERKEALFWQAQNLETSEKFRPEKRYTGSGRERGNSVLRTLGEQKGVLGANGVYDDFRSVNALKLLGNKREAWLKIVPGANRKLSTRTGAEWSAYLKGKDTKPKGWTYKTANGKDAPMNAEEMKWLGIDEFLEFNKNKQITSDEILRYAEDNHFDIQLINGGSTKWADLDLPYLKKDIKINNLHMATSRKTLQTQADNYINNFQSRVENETDVQYIERLKEWIKLPAGKTETGGWKKAVSDLEKGDLKAFKKRVANITTHDETKMPIKGNASRGFSDTIEEFQRFLDGKETVFGVPGARRGGVVSTDTKINDLIKVLALNEDEAVEFFAEIMTMNRVRMAQRSLTKPSPGYVSQMYRSRTEQGMKVGGEVENYKEYMIRVGMNKVSPGWVGTPNVSKAPHYSFAHGYSGHIRVTDDHILDEAGNVQRWAILDEMQSDLDNVSKTGLHKFFNRIVEEVSKTDKDFVLTMPEGEKLNAANFHKEVMKALKGKVDDLAIQMRLGTANRAVLKDVKKEKEGLENIIEFAGEYSKREGYVDRDLAKIFYKNQTGLADKNLFHIKDMAEGIAKTPGLGGTKTYQKHAIKKLIEKLLGDIDSGIHTGKVKPEKLENPLTHVPPMSVAEDSLMPYSGIRLPSAQHVDKSTGGKGYWFDNIIKQAREDYGWGVDWSNKVKYKLYSDQTGNQKLLIHYTKPDGTVVEKTIDFHGNLGINRSHYEQFDLGIGGPARRLELLYTRNAAGKSPLEVKRGAFEGEWITMNSPSGNGGIGNNYKPDGTLGKIFKEVADELSPRLRVDTVYSRGLNGGETANLAKVYEPITGRKIAQMDFNEEINRYSVQKGNAVRAHGEASIAQDELNILFQSDEFAEFRLSTNEELLRRSEFNEYKKEYNHLMDNVPMEFRQNEYHLQQLSSAYTRFRKTESTAKFSLSELDKLKKQHSEEWLKKFNDELLLAGVKTRQVKVPPGSSTTPRHAPNTLIPATGEDVKKYIKVVQFMTDGLPESQRVKVLEKLGFGREIDRVPNIGIEFSRDANGGLQQMKGLGRMFHTDEGVRRASVEFSSSGQTVIRALNSPDLESFIHEMGHILRRTMDEKDLTTLAKALKVEDIKIWSVKEEEAFANAVMDYILHGKGRGATPDLDDAFASMRNIVGDVYQKNYDGNISGKLRSGLESAFGGEGKKAMSYRRVKNQLASAETKLGKSRAIVEDSATQSNELSAKLKLAEEEYRKVADPLRAELEARKASRANRAAAILEKYDRTIRNITGAGRRGKFAGESVQKLRHGAENVAGMYQNMVVKEFDKKVAQFTKMYGMDTEDAHALLLAKVVEKETEVYGRRGFHPSDAIINSDSSGSIDNIMSKYGGRDRIWNDKSLNDMAEKISKMHKEFGLKEAAAGALEVADPKFAYVPLSLTDEAQRAAWAQQSLKRRPGAGTTDVGLSQASSKHRSTNRHWYQVTNESESAWTDADGNHWNYIFSAELDGRKLPAEYEAYRLKYLRQNPDKMLPGDIFDYNQRLKAAGVPVEQHVPGGGIKGGRWVPEATPTSPYELNRPEIRNRFNHVVGNEFGGVLWNTDLMAVIGKRTQQHWRVQAFDDFKNNILPDLKVLRQDDIHDYITNPRGGMSATSVGGEVMVNNVPYRRLDESIRDDRTLKALFGKDAGNMWYPEDVASALDDYVRRISDDKNLSAIGNIFDYVQSIWKGSVLMNPAWTTVNVLGGIIHSVVVGRIGIQDFMEHYPTARKMAHEFHFGNRAGGVIPYGSGFGFDDTKKLLIGGDEMTETEAAHHLVSQNAIDGSQSAREMMMLHRTAFGNKNPHAKKSVADIVRNIATFGPVGGWWFKFNSSIDDTFRTTVYLARRAKGDTADQAALLMKKAHFDYGDFTRYEETIGRRVIPFYAWQRNNIALQSKLLFERPGYVNSYQKIKHALEEEGLNEEDAVPNYMLPRWLKNQLMIQMSGRNGTTKGLTIGNLTPIAELLEIGQVLYGAEGFEDMTNYFINSASPIIKAPFEMATGRQMFDGRSIGDEDLGELSIKDYMLKQIGYYQTWKGLETASTRDGLEGVLWRLIVRGRIQPLDVERLQAGISIEKNERIKLLRRSINKAVQQGDDERAEGLAERIIDEYRVMWSSGLRHRVPKELWGKFNQETAQIRGSGLKAPGENIPVQQPIR